MGRSEVQVDVGAHEALEREAASTIHLALGMPANERMDWLLEKATELGAASFTPLVCERSVLRLAGERAARKQAHWQAIAVAACEQSGRNRVPPVHAPVALADWLAGDAPTLNASTRRLLLSLADDAQPLPATSVRTPWALLSGPEGGLTPHEESMARAAGFEPITLGARVLRAETAPLAALARLAS
jgi:16S rRNA (uracil1498-N3)-methyltransferase